MNERNLPREIRTLLNKLRRRIRAYVVVESAAWLVAVACLLFWVSLTLDVVCFRLTRLELPQWLRVGFDVVAVGALLVVVVERLGVRLFRKLRDRDLALLLEKRFPQLQDRLITVVETPLSETGRVPGLTAAMLQRTRDELQRVLPELRLSDVFATQRLERVVLVALVLLGTVATFGWLRPSSVHRWREAFVTLKYEYWNRRFHLCLKLLEQNGARVREFVDRGSYYECKHARGQPLSVLVVPDQNSPTPNLVELTYQVSRTRTHGSVVCTKFGENRFRHSFGEVYDDLQLWVTGGDYTNRKPYVVRLVEPPHVERTWLDCLYPKYLGREVENPVQDEDGVERDRVPLLGGHVALPEETAFIWRARSDKPLVGLKLKFGRRELTLKLKRKRSERNGKPLAQNNTEQNKAKASASEEAGGGSERAAAGSSNASKTLLAHWSVEFAWLTTFDKNGATKKRQELKPEQARKFILPNRQEFRVPFVLSRAATDAARQRIAQLSNGFLGPCFVLPSDTQMEVYLEDEDGIVNAEPARFSVDVLADSPPVVETELLGVGTSLTKKAVVPVRGVVHDDYGLVKVLFQYRVDNGKWLEYPFRFPVSGTPKEMTLGGEEEVERFPVAPLDLKVGQRLTLTVFAQDNDVLNGPHVTRGEKYVFRIVTDEELRSILYQRELNLRQRFEQVLSELKGVRSELKKRAADASAQSNKQTKTTSADNQSQNAGKELTRGELSRSVVNSAERALQVVRKSSNEVAEIQAAFKDIRAEAVNNQVDTEQMLERLDRRIIEPLQKITDNSFPTTDQTLTKLKQTAEAGEIWLPVLEDSLTDLDGIIQQMQRILQEMHRLETFQEVLETLKAIIKQQKKVSEETKAQHKKRLIERLKELGVE